MSFRALLVLAAFAAFAACKTTGATGATDPNEDVVSQYTDDLQIEDLVTGTGPAAVAGKRVTVNYTGWLTDGRQFDTSIGREPFTFELGGGQVIKGWDQGVQGMKVGGKRRLTIPPHLGYGKRAAGPIPPGSRLIFEVELLGVAD